MTQRPSHSLVRTVLLALLMLLLLGASAQARRPVLSLTLPAAGADAGAPVAYSWTASSVTRGKLVVQRQKGSAHVWRTVARLHGTSGSGSLPALPMGAYQLRIAVLGSHKRTLGQQRYTLRVFAPVPLGTLLGGREVRVFTTPTHAFPYVAYGGPRLTSNAIFTVERNYCRSVRLDFVGSTGSGDPLVTITLSVARQIDDPVVGSATVPAAGAVDAPLIPGQPWSAVAVASTDSSFNLVYVNGEASCYRVEQG